MTDQTLEIAAAFPAGVGRRAPSAGDSPLEREIIEFFVQMADALDMPRSVGELYGALYVSPEPLCMDDLAARLRLSKGATSQGLRLLRGFGAVKTVYVPGDRRDHFAAETGLRKLVAGFLKEQIQPRLTGGADRLERMRAMLASRNGAPAEFLADRVDQLDRWHRRANRLLPVMMRLIVRE
jgi:DNA-binding transcriptional regulator GbsR (MarR family)